MAGDIQFLVTVVTLLLVIDPICALAMNRYCKSGRSSRGSGPERVAATPRCGRFWRERMLLSGALVSGWEGAAPVSGGMTTGDLAPASVDAADCGRGIQRMLQHVKNIQYTLQW
jgi:hypothetical protein